MWEFAHDADGEFVAPFPPNHVELPSPEVNGMSDAHSPFLNGVAELPSPELFGGLPPVTEPRDDEDSDDTP